jgi:hypothetical protein
MSMSGNKPRQTIKSLRFLDLRLNLAKNILLNSIQFIMEKELHGIECQPDYIHLHNL